MADRMKKDGFFDKMKDNGIALAYGDVTLRTCYSEVDLEDIALETYFSRHVALKCPIVSSPMDTITKHEMAIAIARLGGLGIIHKNLTPKVQATEVAKVKYNLNGLIKRPICVQSDVTVESVLQMIAEKDYNFRSFPVLDSSGKLVGIISGSDFTFCMDTATLVKDAMSDVVLTASSKTDQKAALDIMVEKSKKVLPLLDDDGCIYGMYSLTDVIRNIRDDSPLFNTDKGGRLRVGGAVGVGDDAMHRAELMIKKGVDVLVIDTAHGDSKNVINTLRELKISFPDIDVVVGNVSEPESAARLANEGADGIKVGQGPGSICTTRIVAGVGCPQQTAVYECAKAVRGRGIPVCADGGIKYSGDVVKALAAGADNVMLGSVLAGTKETPGDTIIKDGVQVKVYRGMGSIDAMTANKGSRERYGQKDETEDKLVPEGITGTVPYKSEVEKTIYQLTGGVKSGMGYLGSKNIPELQKRADFHRVLPAGIAESHPHSLRSIQETTNYSR